MSEALVSPISRENGWGGYREGGGRPLRTDWQEPYLAALEESGVQHLAAKLVGVDWHTVNAERQRNPEFEDRFVEARERFADLLESELLEVGRGVRKGNPLPYFALLKKHRPMEYHDKLVSLSATVNVNVLATTHEARALLATMLEHVTPATRDLLALPAPTDAVEMPPPEPRSGDAPA